MIRSLIIITASDDTTSLLFCPCVFSEPAATMKPAPSRSAFSTLGGFRWLWSDVLLPPKLHEILPFHPACGAHATHGCVGSNSTAMEYQPRSMTPVSRRTMNGTVRP